MSQAAPCNNLTSARRDPFAYLPSFLRAVCWCSNKCFFCRVHRWDTPQELLIGATYPICRQQPDRRTHAGSSEGVQRRRYFPCLVCILKTMTLVFYPGNYKIGGAAVGHKSKLGLDEIYQVGRVITPEGTVLLPASCCCSHCTTSGSSPYPTIG